MSEAHTSAPAAGATPDPGWFCTIPSGGANAPRAMTTASGLPVVLRDEVDRRSHFDRFGCDVRKANPETPDRVEPEAFFHREVHNGADVRMADGKVVRFWGYDDPTTDRDPTFPSPLMRVREGQVVHVRLDSSGNTHTIHHHGIEPTPHNDGVGHTSFEVDDTYTYQWRASSAGTYFYHCHKNTVLHFELGMYGPLIVDPPEGPGFVRRGAEVVPYDHEMLWIPDDVDPVWHSSMHHSTGLTCDGFDAAGHLLTFRPTYFVLSGVPHPLSRTDPRVAVRCGLGQRVLLRLLNAAYAPVEIRLPFDAEVIGADGHALGGPKVGRYSRPFTVPAGQPITLSTAQRRDVLVVPDRRGTHTVPMEVLHWVREAPVGRIEGTITVE